MPRRGWYADGHRLDAIICNAGIMMLPKLEKSQGRGAKYISKANWEPNVVEDGALMTGQSPASAAPLAEALAKRLK